MATKDVIEEVKKLQHKNPLVLVNKADNHDQKGLQNFCDSLGEIDAVVISAQTGKGLDKLTQYLVRFVNHTSYDTVVSSNRHYGELQQALGAILAVREGLTGGLSGDLLAVDLRSALHHLGTLTGAISTDELLGNIFESFCIGK
jgi:tRNA modification GTPase